MLIDANSLRSALLSADGQIKWKVIGLGNDVFVSWNGQPAIAIRCDKDFLKAVDLCLYWARKYLGASYQEPQKNTQTYSGAVTKTVAGYREIEPDVYQLPKKTKAETFSVAVAMENKQQPEPARREPLKVTRKREIQLSVDGIMKAIAGSFVNNGSCQQRPSRVAPVRHTFYDKRRDEMRGVDSDDYGFSFAEIGPRASLHDDGPGLYERVDAALGCAMRDAYSPHGMFLGDDMDMTYTDQKNGLEFFGHDRSGHSGRTRHAALE